MSNSSVLAAAVGLLILGLAGLGWVFREQRVPRPRRARQFLVLLPCLVLITLSATGLRWWWIERPDRPATVEDLRIMDRAIGILKDEASWNRKDDRECADDTANRKWSLFCALELACTEVLGEYDHRRVALQEVRFAVEDATHGREFEHRLMDFNNLPETRFEDVRNVLQVARSRVAARLTVQHP
jgi:hypothetical protein